MRKLLWLSVLLLSSTVQAQLIGPVDRQTVETFGESFARAINERDARAAADLIDLKALAIRAAQVQGFGQADQDAYVRGIGESLGSGRLIDRFFRSLDASKGTARFMRVTDTRPMRALVRFDHGASGFDYLEFVVETGSGRPRAVDWYQLTAGQLFSVTLGGIGQLFTTTDSSLLGRLLGVKSVDKEMLGLMKRIGELQGAGKYAESVELFGKLPDPVANARIMLFLRSQAALHAGMDDEYGRVLATMARKYSDDPVTAFMLIDHYFNVKDFAKALAAIDIVEKRVGKDAVMSLLRAVLYLEAGDFGNMLKHSEESIALESDRMSGYDMRATALVRLGRHADAVAAYRDMESRFDLEFTREIFAEDPTFGKFVASKEFGKWLPR